MNYDELTQKERDIITTTDGDNSEFDSLEDFKEYIAEYFNDENDELLNECVEMLRKGD